VCRAKDNHGIEMDNHGTDRQTNKTKDWVSFHMLQGQFNS